MSNTKLIQFTKKQIAVASKIAEGYSYRDIEKAGIASRNYIEYLRRNPNFNRYLYSLVEEWKKDCRNELLLIAMQKIKELISLKPKKDLLDYLDYVTKLTGKYAPAEYKFEHSYTEADINSRFEKLMAEIESQSEIGSIVDTGRLQDTEREN